MERRLPTELLIDLATCAGCSHRLGLLTAQCVNGHVVCPECRRDQHSCPSCSDPFSDLKTNVFVNKVLQVLRRSNLFQDQSAENDVEKYHELFCSLDTTGCFICHVQVPASDMFKHVKHDHPTSPLSENNPLKICWRYFHLEKPGKMYSACYVYGHFIWIGLVNQPASSTLTVFFAILSSGKEGCELLAKAEFQSCRRLYSAEVSLSEDSRTANTVVIPHSVVQHYIDKSNSVKFTVSFSKR